MAALSVVDPAASVVGYCGKISFSLYLLHAIVLFLMKEIVSMIAITPWFFVNYVINSGILLTLCVALASLGFYFIESPFLKLRKRYVSQNAGEAAGEGLRTPLFDSSRAYGRSSKHEKMVE